MRAGYWFICGECHFLYRGVGDSHNARFDCFSDMMGFLLILSSPEDRGSEGGQPIAAGIATSGIELN